MVRLSDRLSFSSTSSTRTNMSAIRPESEAEHLRALRRRLEDASEVLERNLADVSWVLDQMWRRRDLTDMVQTIERATARINAIVRAGRTGSSGDELNSALAAHRAAETELASHARSLRSWWENNAEMLENRARDYGELQEEARERLDLGLGRQRMGPSPDFSFEDLRVEIECIEYELAGRRVEDPRSCPMCRQSGEWRLCPEGESREWTSLECPVCHEVAGGGIVYPCFHSLCRKCYGPPPAAAKPTTAETMILAWGRDPAYREWLLNRPSHQFFF